ncbi:hypothetical protein RJ641_030676 [Dillenia turbinata]|uniref:Uncharacterized protein n=1 Tax=Dillenia turbinata TaxID=194707 RepID=A0AAN8ZPB7_9MAGN
MCRPYMRMVGRTFGYIILGHYVVYLKNLLLQRTGMRVNMINLGAFSSSMTLQKLNPQCGAKVFDEKLHLICDELRIELKNVTIIYVDVFTIRYDLIANATKYDPQCGAKAFDEKLHLICDELRVELKNVTIIYVDVFTIRYDLIANATKYEYIQTWWAELLAHNSGPLGRLPVKLAITCKNTSDLDQYGCLQSLNDGAKAFNEKLHSVMN